MNPKRRRAISRSQARKLGRGVGIIYDGMKAFKAGEPAEVNPFSPDKKPKEFRLWLGGWEWGQEKENG